MKQFSTRALVVGRIGLIRSLGRVGVPVTAAREASLSIERSSRYCDEYISLPNLSLYPDQALRALEEYGKKQSEKPVAIFNGESDVMLFSKQRERLGRYYRIILSRDDLIDALVDKAKFCVLAEKHCLSVPRTEIPNSRSECFEAAERIGFPCVVKPIAQRLWHEEWVLRAIGLRKGILVENQMGLRRIADSAPFFAGKEMIQEYVPGDDSCLYEFHVYIDQQGIPRGYLLGQKIRTNPIHFGMGAYTKYAEERTVTESCLDALGSIGYIGAADIDLKRHAVTGKYYILEINPRFSLWTILGTVCGVNLPLLQYKDALDLSFDGTEVSNPKPGRWLWFGADFRAMLAYRRAGELTILRWLKSFWSEKGKLEFHVFSWDDPLPLFVSWYIELLHFKRRVVRRIRQLLKSPTIEML